MIAICGRDRKDLVQQCIESICSLEALADEHVLFHLDPATTEYDAKWLDIGGVDEVRTAGGKMPEQPQRRVAAMRADAVLTALDRKEERIIFLDSDVVISREFPYELDRLWALRERFDCGAVTLGNYAGYTIPGYLVQQCPPYKCSVRTHALGGCMVYPVTESLLTAICKVVKDQETYPQAWDSALSVSIGGSRILTSDRSYVRHLGHKSGMCKVRGIDPDWHKFASDLEVH